MQAVQTIHEARIVHSDLKPANFLMVEGQLKLIDFGIAKAIQSDTTSIARENQVGTLNYMSPEAILGGHNNIRGGPPMKVITFVMAAESMPLSQSHLYKGHPITCVGYADQSLHIFEISSGTHLCAWLRLSMGLCIVVPDAMPSAGLYRKTFIARRSKLLLSAN